MSCYQEKLPNGWMLKGQKIIKSVYFQLVRDLLGGEENNLVIGLKSGGKD
jgi:hypothetical protein